MVTLSPGGDVHRAQAHSAVAEGRVRQPVAERPQRVPVHLDILFAAAGPLRIVAGHLADAAREGDGQPPGRRVVAEQRFGHGQPALLAREPGFQNGGQVLVFPGGGDRPPALQHQNDRRAGGPHGLGQRQLAAGQVERSAVKVFAAGLLVVAQAEHGHVGPGGQRQQTGACCAGRFSGQSAGMVA